MTLSGAMMFFLAGFFLWHTITAIIVLVRYKLDRSERGWLFLYMLLCSLGLALFGVGAICEIVRLVRMYG